MSGKTTRRCFFRKAAAASGGLVLLGVNRTASAARPAGKQSERPSQGGVDVASDSQSVAVGSPVIVVTQSVSRDVNPRAGSWVYVTEVLGRAGLHVDEVSPEHILSLLGYRRPIVVLAGDLQLTSAQREALTTLVKMGGSLIGIGGTSRLDKVFGVRGERPLAEGWIKVTAEDHPVTAGLRSSLHVFGGFSVQAGSATSLAQVESGQQGAKGSAIVENRFGEGRAILLGPDLLFSIVHIQQGVPVLQDGRAAPDDSAALNDGELKAEDGMVLDWGRDRTPMRPDGVPVFLEPVTDELREIILRSIFHVAKVQGIPLPVIWYWPRGLKAVGHISHDTDGHDPAKAEALLKVMNRCAVKSTWCTLYPGGYPKEFYRTLQEQRFEIALHYDARSGGPETSWSKENLLLQHRWLKKEAGLKNIVSNKNHYTRWEGRLDFLRWCEELGIHSDQTRGPSKGTIGFPLGGSQPYFPVDDEAESPRLLNVLEVNMLTQDLVVVCPAEYGRQLLDSVLRHHGVAHFLFHPAHILKPNVADTLCGLADYGREQGLEWWTNEQIYKWEARRRIVEVTRQKPNLFTFRSAEPLREATLLFLRSRPEPRSVIVNGQPARNTRRRFYGFEFDAVTMDLAGEVQVRIA